MSNKVKPIKPGKAVYDPEIQNMPPKNKILFDIQFKGKFYPVDTEGIVYFKNTKIHVDAFEKILLKTKKKSNEKQLTAKEEGDKLLKELENSVDKYIKEKVPKIKAGMKKHGISQNNWVNFVKAEAKKRGVSYACALSMPIVKLKWQKKKLNE